MASASFVSLSDCSLSLQSEKVGEAILLLKFYNEPLGFQKNMPLIIMRSQRPVRLAAGPFGSLSLQLFATVRNILPPLGLSMELEN
jgi:hypothetical protein